MQHSKKLHSNLKDKAELVSTIVCGDALVYQKKKTRGKKLFDSPRRLLDFLCTK
jgi:hypothetical protein